MRLTIHYQGVNASQFRHGDKAFFVYGFQKSERDSLDQDDAGVIGKQTMRRFDEACLTPVHAFTAEEIRKLREREQVSQSVFANHLNVTKDSVSQWGRGASDRLDRF